MSPYQTLLSMKSCKIRKIVKMNPYFSIIIPSFNSESTLDIALRSIVKQTFKTFEIVMIDGQSTDATLDIAKRYQKEFSSIIIRSEEDKGIYDAMNKAIGVAKGEWLYFMGSDDSFFNCDVLKLIVDSEKLSNYDIVYGDVTSPRFNGIYDGPFSPDKIAFKNICHQSIFIKHTVFNKIGNFNLRYTFHADYDHNLRWFFNRRIKHSYLNIIIANYADGGFSSHNFDYKFDAIRPLKCLLLGFRSLKKKTIIKLLKQFFSKNKKTKT